MTIKFSENYKDNHIEEHFKFHFDIKDKEVFTEEEKKRIEEMATGMTFEQLRPGDTFSFTYEVFITYFGQVARKLETMLMIMGKCHDFQVRTEELNHGKCLVQEVFCLIEEIERKYIDFSQI